MKRIIYIKAYFFSLILLSALCTIAQNKNTKPLKIGDSASDLVFGNVNNYKQKSLAINDLKGKYVILDFWANGCTSCYEAMPKLEQLQKKYGDKIQIILINPWENEQTARKRLGERIKAIPNFHFPNVPYILGDTIWRYIFPHKIVPHHVWIDPQGKVVAITNGWNTNEEGISTLLNGKRQNFELKDDFRLAGKNVRRESILQPIDSSVRVAYYSAVVQYHPNFGMRTGERVDSIKQTYRFYRFNSPILELYRAACQVPPFEKKRILLEVRHPEDLVLPKETNKWDEFTKINCFSYELLTPISWQSRTRTLMLQDLNRYFAYTRGITGGMEERMYPSYVLTLDKSYKASTTARGDTIINKGSTFLYVNQTLKSIESYFRNCLEDFNKPLAFIEETGREKEERFTIELPNGRGWSDIEQLIIMLRKQGWILKKEERKIAMLVIKDGKAD